MQLRTGTRRFAHIRRHTRLAGVYSKSRKQKAPQQPNAAEQHGPNAEKCTLGTREKLKIDRNVNKSCYGFLFGRLSREQQVILNK